MMDLLMGMLGVSALAAAWVVVQLAWARSFPDDESDEPDVLARRRDCSGCSHPGSCMTRPSRQEVPR